MPGPRCFRPLMSALLLTIVPALPARAQDADVPPVNEGRGFFMIGASGLDLAALNDRLGRQDYPALPETMLTLGGGGYGVQQRWVIGGEGGAVIGSTRETVQQGGTLEAQLRGGYGFFDLGYLIVKRDHLHVYPLIGVGGGGMQLSFRETAERTFDDLLENPRTGSTATTGGFLMQVAVGIDHLFVLERSTQDGRRTEGGIALGVRAGYMFTPFQGGWMTEGADLRGGPDLGITGPYVSVVIGGGGRQTPLPD